MKAPSPVAAQDEEEDSRQSGEGRISDIARVQNAETIDSDSDAESTQKVPTKRQIASLPSSTSSSSSSSSSSSDDEEEQSSSSSSSSSSDSSSSSESSDDEVSFSSFKLKYCKKT